MIQKIPIGRKPIIFFFFAGLLILGAAVHRDYGVHWDEHNNQAFGNKWARYVVNVAAGDSGSRFQLPPLIEHDWIHGPIVEIFLVFMQKTLKLSESRDIIFMRHLVIFLLFYAGVCFFYLLCTVHFKSWKIGLLGSLFLIISPRIFADSFYNSVDAVFLSFYIISMYSLLKVLEKKTFSAIFVHACVCAVLIDVKFTGITVPLYTLVFLTADIVAASGTQGKARGASALAFYTAVLILLVILFWPLLWTDTFSHLKTAVEQMNQHRWGLSYLYLGKYLTTNEQPWHYAPVWIMITTPALYILFFYAGVFFALKSFFGKETAPTFNKRNNFLFLLWFLVPLIAGRGRFYDGWRHIYFVYPALLIFSVTGIVSLWELVKARSRGRACQAVHFLFVFFVTLSLAPVVYFMARYHPYQNVYFNILAGRTMAEIKNNFELDYWGLSFRKGLEFIVRTDPDKTIKVYAADYPGIISADILPPDDRARLAYVGSPDDAKYFLSDYRWHKEEYPYKDEYFSTRVGGAKIMVVYRLHNE